MGGSSVLVLNSGSSSIKYALYRLGTSCVAKGRVEGIGTTKCFITHKNLHIGEDTTIQGNDVDDHKMGLKKVLDLLNPHTNHSDGLYGVGHRVTHGGELLREPVIITKDVKRKIEKASPLAPLHNPSNLEGIQIAQELFGCPQVAVFDTAFHKTIPIHAYTYGLPYRYYEELGIRRYGFHGISYEFILDELETHMGKAKDELNVIGLHLGAGSSMVAIKNGKSIDTTMGFTPLEGLVMATRCGDIDPSIFDILATRKGLSIVEIVRILMKESGFYGICGDADMRAIVHASNNGSEKHKLALQVYVHRIRKYLGAYYAQLEGKVDALVFCGGIGERSALVREMACKGFGALGIGIDEAKNREEALGLREIQAKGSRTKVLVIPTDEELCIARHTFGLLKKSI